MSPSAGQGHRKLKHRVRETAVEGQRLEEKETLGLHSFFLFHSPLYLCQEKADQNQALSIYITSQYKHLEQDEEDVLGNLIVDGRWP